MGALWRMEKVNGVCCALRMKHTVTERQQTVFLAKNTDRNGHTHTIPVNIAIYRGDAFFGAKTVSI